jgi:hypothetical protein
MLLILQLFVGRAGYICGALWLRQQLGYDVVPLPKLHKICDSILESGRTYSRRKRSLCPLMFAYYDTEYLGAAHGLCAILQVKTILLVFSVSPADRYSLFFIMGPCYVNVLQLLMVIAGYHCNL